MFLTSSLHTDVSMTWLSIQHGELNSVGLLNKRATITTRHVNHTLMFIYICKTAKTNEIHIWCFIKKKIQLYAEYYKHTWQRLNITLLDCNKPPLQSNVNRKPFKLYSLDKYYVTSYVSVDEWICYNTNTNGFMHFYEAVD